MSVVLEVFLLCALVMLGATIILELIESFCKLNDKEKDDDED